MASQNTAAAAEFQTRTFPSEVVRVLEEGEHPLSSDRIKMYFVRIIGPDGGPLVLNLPMNVTMEELNNKLDNKYGENCLFLGVKDEEDNVTVDAGPGWRPYDLVEMGKRLAVMMRM